MLGKPPTLDPSMEDGAVVVPLSTPPVVGRVPAAAELLPRPRERAVGAEKPPRPRVRAGAAAAASNANGVVPFFFLAAAAMEFGGGDGGGLGELGDMTGKMDWARKTPARAQISCHCAPPARDPSAPSTLEDEAVQRSRRRRFHLGAREMPVASRGDGARVAWLDGGLPEK